MRFLGGRIPASGKVLFRESARARFTNILSNPDRWAIAPTRRILFIFNEIPPKTASIVWDLEYRVG